MGADPVAATMPGREAGPVSRFPVRALLVALPLAFLGAVAVTAWLGHTSVLPLLILGPALAAVYCGPWWTAATGTAADGICSGVDASRHLFLSLQQVAIFAAVLGVTVTAVVTSAARRRRAAELAGVATIADVAQRALLRPLPVQVASPVTVAVRYMSATSGARIGGDLYEVITARSGMRLIIGDVQGKGLGAVMTAAAVLGTFREIGADAPDLAVIADRIETSLARQLTDEEFVTAMLAEVSSDGSALSLLNCGHPPPVYVGTARARFVETGRPGLPLGLEPLAPSRRETARIPLSQGDSVLFYTDGVSEARNRSGEYFSLTDCQALRGTADPDRALDLLGDEVTRHVGHALDDDAAMLLIHRA